MGFKAFEQSLKRPCLSFRFGDRWLNNTTLNLVERLGARFDLTTEPGREKLVIPEPWTGRPPDYTLVPRRPYHPARANFSEDSDSRSRNLWAVPLSTFNPDQVWRFLSGDGRAPRKISFIEKLRKASTMINNGYEGFLDRADYEVIAGWAYDTRQRDQPLEIELYDGRVMLATVSADGFRRDLLQAGKGNGRHSFALPTPTCLKDGKPHSIRARVANSRFDLIGSPRAMKTDLPPLVEHNVLLLDLGGEPWLASRIIDLAVSAPGKPYLATSLRTHEVLIPCRRANLNETFALSLSHSHAKDFVFETPAELVARMTSIKDLPHAN
jgi:hypothetical protein